MAHETELEWLRQTVGVRALPERTIVTVRGDDAFTWLQGQVTNQIEGLEPGQSAYGFILTLKGRIMADAWIVRRPDEVWLEVPAANLDALLARLDRYIIMEDVDLVVRPELHVLTALGPRAAELAGHDGWPSDRLGTGGRSWAVAEEALDSEWRRSVDEARTLGGGPLDEQTWADAHVVLGRPRFGVDFGDWTYPQESGLGPLAVSFTKGCYIGQETVVMLENRGKAPKMLWRWALEEPRPPKAKTPIERDGVVVGEVTSSASVGDRAVALGFVKRGHEVDAQSEVVIDGVPAHPLGAVEEGLGAKPGSP